MKRRRIRQSQENIDLLNADLTEKEKNIFKAIREAKEKEYKDAIKEHIRSLILEANNILDPRLRKLKLERYKAILEAEGIGGDLITEVSNALADADKALADQASLIGNALPLSTESKEPQLHNMDVRQLLETRWAAIQNLSNYLDQHRSTMDNCFARTQKGETSPVEELTVVFGIAPMLRQINACTEEFKSRSLEITKEHGALQAEDIALKQVQEERKTGVQKPASIQANVELSAHDGLVQAGRQMTDEQIVVRREAIRDMEKALADAQREIIDGQQAHDKLLDRLQPAIQHAQAVAALNLNNPELTDELRAQAAEIQNGLTPTDVAIHSPAIPSSPFQEEADKDKKPKTPVAHLPKEEAELVRAEAQKLADKLTTIVEPKHDAKNSKSDDKDIEEKRAVEASKGSFGKKKPKPPQMSR